MSDQKPDRSLLGRLGQLGIALLVLLLVLAGIAAWLVGTTAGGRIALSVAEGFLPDELTVDIQSFDGRLISRFELRGVTFQLPTLEGEADRITVDWRGSGILLRKAHVRSLVAEGLDLRVVDPDPESLPDEPMPEPEGEPQPPLSDLPVAFSFDSLAVLGGSFTAQDSLQVTGVQAMVSGPRASIPGSLDDYRISASAQVEMPELTSAAARLYGEGSSTGVRIDSVFLELLDGHVVAEGALTWWPGLTWDVLVEGDELQPASLLPDPEAWPGQLSVRGSATGGVRDGELELQAAIDTVYGTVRDESVQGRLEVHLRGQEIELPAARLNWGQTRVTASGTASEALDLVFDADVPEIGLVLPGASGSLTASGSATGPRDAPRLRAAVRADSIVIDGASAASLSGDVDLDLAGPLRADLVARSIVVAGQELNSARLGLTGQREAHTLELTAAGPGLEFDIAAAGGLDAADTWSGVVDTFHLAADTVGTWELTAPAALTLATADELDLVFEQICLESSLSARLCAEGEIGGGVTRLSATVDSFRVERFSALMPEGYAAHAGIDAVIDIRQVPGGAFTGTIDVRTTEGSATVPIGHDPDTGEESTTLLFEPIVLAVSSTDGGSSAVLDLLVIDSTSNQFVRVDGELDSPFAFYQPTDLESLEDQPFSARLELAFDDLELLSDSVRLGSEAQGRIHVVTDLDVDEQGGMAKRISATVDSFRVERLAAFMPEGYAAQAGVDAVVDVQQLPGGAFTGTVDLQTTAGSATLPIGLDRDAREESTTLFFEPIVLAVSSADGGSSAVLDLLVADSAGNQLVRVDGELDSPFAFHQLSDLESLDGQPYSAHLELAIDDLEQFSASVLRRWNARGSVHVVADLDVDGDGRLEGTLSASADSLRMRNTVRQQAWRLDVNPARLEARVGPDGLAGELELEISVVDEGRLLRAEGQVRMPQLTSLNVDPEAQPVDASLSVRVDDMYFIEAFLPGVTEAHGSFDLDSQIGGSLAELTVDGQAILADGRALIPVLGLALTDIQFAATGRPEGGIDLEGQVRSGDGILTLSGRSERYPSAETPTRMSIRSERFRIIDAPEISLVAEPSLDLAFDGSKLSVTGDVRIPRGRVGIPEVPESAVTPSKDVVIVGDTLVVRDAPVPIEADIRVTLGDDVFFSGMGFNSSLTGQVRITQEAGRDPRGRGEVRIVNGTFRQLGQELRVDPGRLLFNGPIDDPAVEAQAFVRATDGTEAGFRVRGTVQNLDVTTYSVPPRSDSDIMAYILFGRPMSETTGTQGNQATNAATVLGANMLAMSLAPRVGLDEARVETGTQQNQAQFVVGKYLSPRLYVGYGIGIYEPISTLRLRYLLTARWTVEAITGDQQSADILWRIETGGPKEEPVSEAAEGVEGVESAPGATDPGAAPPAEPDPDTAADPASGTEPASGA